MGGGFGAAVRWRLNKSAKTEPEVSRGAALGSLPKVVKGTGGLFRSVAFVMRFLPCIFNSIMRLFDIIVTREYSPCLARACLIIESWSAGSHVLQIINGAASGPNRPGVARKAPVAVGSWASAKSNIR